MTRANSSMAKEPRRLRVYEQWQGNERFFCWGHCVTGPSWKSGMGTLVLLIAPTIVFLVFVAPYMSAKVTPAIMVISCVFPVFCMSMLLLTSCRDPGILPRQEPDEEWLQGRKPRARDVAVNGHRVTVRYNDTCHFYQPPRAHHCSVNDNCIERFDHHCPWVGTTIGKRNYRTFLLFIYSTSLYIAWTFGVCLGSLFVKHKELQQAAGPESDNIMNNLWLTTLGQSGAAIAIMIFTFIFFWFVCGLSGFHTWLVATNQTTYENFRYNHNQVPNPYNEGVFSNCASVWCVRIPPSKVQFRAYIDEVQRVPVEMGYPDWNAAATLNSPVRPGMRDGPAVEMQDTNYAQGRLGGMNRDAMPQSYESDGPVPAQAPVTRTNGHSILGGDSAQEYPQQQQMNSIPNAQSWQSGRSESLGSRDERAFVTASGAASDAYDNQPQQQDFAVGSPPGNSGMVGGDSNLGIASNGRAGSLSSTVQAMRAAATAAPPWHVGHAHADTAGVLQQQPGPAQTAYSPLGEAAGQGASSPAAAVAPDHIGIHIPPAHAAGVRTNSRQHVEQPQQYADLAGGYRHVLQDDVALAAAGSSSATEYHDARRSQASWDSAENSETDGPVSTRPL